MNDIATLEALSNFIGTPAKSKKTAQFSTLYEGCIFIETIDGQATYSASGYLPLRIKECVPDELGNCELPKIMRDALFSEDARAWNIMHRRFHQIYPEAILDLRNQDLSRMNLSGFNFSKCDLRNAKWSWEPSRNRDILLQDSKIGIRGARPNVPDFIETAHRLANPQRYPSNGIGFER